MAIGTLIATGTVGLHSNSGEAKAHDLNKNENRFVEGVLHPVHRTVEEPQQAVVEIPVKRAKVNKSDRGSHNRFDDESSIIIFLPLANQEQTMDMLTHEINTQIKCMAENIYWEARNQSKLGMIAVGRVVVNRVRNKRYPNTVCDVVLQGPVRESWKTRRQENLSDEERQYYPIRNRCQFSWYCDGQSDKVRRGENDIFTTAWHIATAIILDNRWDGFIGGATHYHATYVAPIWRHDLTLVSRIDDHIFYRP